MTVYIASSEYCESKKFVWHGNKIERMYIQEQQSNQFQCYNQNIGFVKRIDQILAKHRIGIQIITYRNTWLEN